MDLNHTIEALGRAFEEFKSANDQQIAELKKSGVTEPVLDEKLAKINDEINRLTELKNRLDKVETKLNRPGAAGGVSEKDELAAEHKAAFETFFRKGVEGNLREIERKAMSVGSDPDGGYVVPVIMANRIIQTIFETSPMRQVANVISITSDSVEMLVDKDEAATGGWVGETATRSETDTPQLAKLSIQVHEQYAEPRATQKLLDDANFNIEEWLASKVRDKFARTENAAFLTGNGVAKPRGLLSYSAVADANYAWGSIGYIATGASGDWAASNPADKLVDLVYALKAGYRQGAAFLMARARVGEIRKFKDGQGQYIWQPGLQAGQPSSILSYPVVEAEDMPAKAANSLSVCFGNFREAFQIVDRIGIRVLRDPYTAKPYIKFYTTKRVGSDVTNFEAFKALKFASS